MYDNDADKKCSIHEIFITKSTHGRLSPTYASGLLGRGSKCGSPLMPCLRDYWWYSCILRNKPTIFKFDKLSLVSFGAMFKGNVTTFDLGLSNLQLLHINK